MKMLGLLICLRCHVWTDGLCTFIAEHSASNVRPGQTQLKNLAGVNTAISIVYNQSKIKLFR